MEWKNVCIARTATQRIENTKQKKRESNKLKYLDFLRNQFHKEHSQVRRKSHHIWQGTKQVLQNRTQAYMLKYGIIDKLPLF